MSIKLTSDKLISQTTILFGIITCPSDVFRSAQNGSFVGMYFLSTAKLNIK